jgi:hypothetical protein
MGRYSDYEDFKEAMFYERHEYYNDYLNDDDNEDFIERGDFYYDYYHYDYYLNDDDNKESLKIKNSFYWIKLVQRHWKKTFNTNKKYKGMLSIYKL